MQSLAASTLLAALIDCLLGMGESTFSSVALFGFPFQMVIEAASATTSALFGLLEGPFQVEFVAASTTTSALWIASLAWGRAPFLLLLSLVYHSKCRVSQLVLYY